MIHHAIFREYRNEHIIANFTLPRIAILLRSKCSKSHNFASICIIFACADGQFHDERDKVKINKYVYFHCKLIALTQTVLYVLGKNIFILLANLFS